MKFYIVDAFAEEVFGGNPAGVVILGKDDEYPDDETMRRTAAELRYSETAFIKQLAEDKFQLRYFTPAAEVDLCGHATIGSFAALIKEGLVERNGEYRALTLAGELEINTQEGFVMMEMSAPKLLRRIETEEEILELYRVMGLEYEPPIAQCGCSEDMRLIPLIISTGLPDIIMPVADRKTLEAIKPDFPALSALSEKYQVTGVHAFTLEHESYDVTAHCRNFAPLYDIDEESATGTSSGALTYYLYECQLIRDGKECRFIQGEAMGRPSVICSHIAETEDAAAPNGKAVKIQVGGTAAILASGTINL